MRYRMSPGGTSGARNLMKRSRRDPSSAAATFHFKLLKFEAIVVQVAAENFVGRVHRSCEWDVGGVLPFAAWEQYLK